MSVLPFPHAFAAEIDGQPCGIIKFEDRDELTAAECRMLAAQLLAIAEFLEETGDIQC